MQTLDVHTEPPTKQELSSLNERCRAALDRLKGEESEVRLPVFVEFSGSPKSGKTTIIGIVTHFLKRNEFDVITPAEGASLRTPPGLRDDWMSFNAWSGCYALQRILEDCSADPPPDVVILDRGLFDLAAWAEFLCASQRRITEEDRERFIEFFTLDLWSRREIAVFLFTADHQTSLKRENQDKLTDKPGSVMNKETLSQLRKAYEYAASRLSSCFPRLYHVDTSYRNGGPPSFQRIAFVVADKLVTLMEELGTQMILVTRTTEFTGFVLDNERVQKTERAILQKPTFLKREEAESSRDYQQVVPYAVLKNEDGRFFWARRRADVRRKELRGKYTILVGGHAEKRDLDPGQPEAVFQTCLKRELEEELIGLRIGKIQPLGFIHDPRNEMGAHHLAYVHEVEVSGRTLIRRQAIDKEFGREGVSWKTGDEIKEAAGELDPWSQLVAQKLFGAAVPDPTLFSTLDG